MMKHVTYLLGIGIFIFATGCKKKKEDEETVRDLCREQCDLSAEACPADSVVGQSAEFCKFFCVAYETSDSCYEKFELYMTCLANHDPVCDASGTLPECEEEAAPFTLDGTGMNMHGECVQEGVTAE